MTAINETDYAKLIRRCYRHCSAPALGSGQCLQFVALVPALALGHVAMAPRRASGRVND